MSNKKISKSNKKKILWGILTGIVLVLISFRLYLPTLVINYVNKTLQELNGYTGHVDDIDISLYRGSYQIQGIKVEKTEGKIPVPFFQAEELDISIEWKAILNAAIVAEITIEKPKINFVKGPTKEESQTKVDSSWIDVVDKWLPIKLNKLRIKDGEIHYHDFHSKPKLDIAMKECELLATNLSNSKKTKELLPSTIEGRGKAYGNGDFDLKMKMNALAKTPTFDLNARLKNVDLTKLNDFLKAYANIDVKKGSFGLYTEIAAKDRKYKGYVKPTLENLDIVQLDKKEGNILQIAWETIVAAAAEVLKNKKEDRVASKAPFQGSFKETDVDVWATIGSLLKNAFIQALMPSIDQSININDVKEGQVPKSKKELRKERREQRKEERRKKKEDT